MADITKESYNEANRFSKILFQRGKDVIDFELNEFQDVQRINIYRALKAGFQLPTSPQVAGSNDNGWLVTGTGANNEVTIGEGFLFPDGISLINPAAFAFNGLSTNNGGNPRIDVVYVRLEEQEVADPNTVAELGETSRRRQLVPSIGVVEGTPAASPVAPSLPADSSTEIWEGGVRYYALAEILRPDGQDNIDAGDVTDLRLLLPPAILDYITDRTFSPGNTFQEFIGQWELTCSQDASQLADFRGADALKNCIAYVNAFATNVGVVIRLKNGVYNVDEELEINGSCKIIGAGPREVFLEVGGVGHANNVFNIDNDSDDFHLEGVSLNTSTAQATAFAVTSTNLRCGKIYVKNCDITGHMKFTNPIDGSGGDVEANNAEAPMPSIVFEDVRWRNISDSPNLEISIGGSTTQGSYTGGVLFNRCGLTQDTGNHPFMLVDDLAGANAWGIRNITWVDSFVRLRGGDIDPSAGTYDGTDNCGVLYFAEKTTNVKSEVDKVAFIRTRVWSEGGFGANPCVQFLDWRNTEDSSGVHNNGGWNVYDLIIEDSDFVAEPGTYGVSPFHLGPRGGVYTVPIHRVGNPMNESYVNMPRKLTVRNMKIGYSNGITLDPDPSNATSGPVQYGVTSQFGIDVGGAMVLAAREVDVDGIKFVNPSADSTLGEAVVLGAMKCEFKNFTCTEKWHAGTGSVPAYRFYACGTSVTRGDQDALFEGINYSSDFEGFFDYGNALISPRHPGPTQQRIVFRKCRFRNISPTFADPVIEIRNTLDGVGVGTNVLIDECHFLQVDDNNAGFCEMVDILAEGSPPLPVRVEVRDSVFRDTRGYGVRFNGLLGGGVASHGRDGFFKVHDCYFEECDLGGIDFFQTSDSATNADNRFLPAFTDNTFVDCGFGYSPGARQFAGILIATEAVFADGLDFYWLQVTGNIGVRSGSTGQPLIYFRLPDANDCSFMSGLGTPSGGNVAVPGTFASLPNNTIMVHNSGFRTSKENP